MGKGMGSRHAGDFWCPKEDEISASLSPVDNIFHCVCCRKMVRLGSSSPQTHSYSLGNSEGSCSVSCGYCCIAGRTPLFPDKPTNTGLDVPTRGTLRSALFDSSEQWGWLLVPAQTAGPGGNSVCGLGPKKGR